jgi:hypothetical protein
MKASSRGITLKAVHQPERNCTGCYFDQPKYCSKADPRGPVVADLAEAVLTAEFIAGKSCNTHPLIWVTE